MAVVLWDALNYVRDGLGVVARKRTRNECMVLLAEDSESGRLWVRRESNTRINVREIDFEKGSRMEVAEDRVQWRVFWLSLFNFQVIMLKIEVS